MTRITEQTAHQLTAQILTAFASRQQSEQARAFPLLAWDAGKQAGECLGDIYQALFDRIMSAEPARESRRGGE